MNNTSGHPRQPSGPERPIPRPSRRGAVVIVAAATLLLGTLAVVAILDPHDDRSPSTDSGAVGAVFVGHIHAIVADPSQPGSSRVVIGTHQGLFAVNSPSGSDRRGHVSRIGAGTQDVMGLVNAEPGRLLASGHPAAADSAQPANLGLVESRNGGRTWRPVSLRGGADFHALEHTPTRTWGIDAASGGLLTSTDEQAWKTVSGPATGAPFLDLAVDPDNPDLAVVTTGDGQLVEVSPDGDAQGFGDGSEFGYIDWPRADTLVGVGADGAVHRSTDRGDTWTVLVTVAGAPTALAVMGDMWYVATTDGLFRGRLDASGGPATRILAFPG